MEYPYPRKIQNCPYYCAIQFLARKIHVRLIQTATSPRNQFCEPH